ncbi:MAG: alanyl-tRNA editing protein [Bryobacter sp.]|nr:alanyl-tRNA editing protein [Bryobacter sp.]
MTERLYYADAYLKQFDAQVVSLSGDGLRVVLNRTAFYPESGGQPADRGTLNGIAVVGLEEVGEEIVHVLERPFEAREVVGEIDAERRRDHREQHTGQHLLSAVLAAEFQLATVSFHMGADYATIDLEGPAPDANTLLEIERRANEVIRENRAVSLAYEDASTAEGLRKASERSGILRIVTIESLDRSALDRSACGGTHVRHTGEIGSIRLGKTEKVRQATRLYFYCGGRALAFTARQLRELAASEAQARVRLAEAEKNLGKAKAELAQWRGEARYRQAEGKRWVEAVEAISEELRLEANAFLAGAGARVLLYAAGSGAVLLGAAADTGWDCGQRLRAHGVKGGGTAQLAQGKASGSQSWEELQRLLLAD